MEAKEMAKFFAWIEEIYGPEELLDLADTDENHVQSLINRFRNSKTD